MAPQGPVDIPPAVSEFASGRPVKAVWKNGLGGLTFRVGSGDTPHFLKWTPRGSGIGPCAEATRLRWAADCTAVPNVVGTGADDTGSWMVTDGLPGRRMAVDDHWKRDPATAVHAIGTGLRALHTRLPVADCPFDWSAEQRLKAVRARAADGRTLPADWSPTTVTSARSSMLSASSPTSRRRTGSSFATETPALPTP
ncbi:phosphotransferase [Streptomyces meridianus]